MIFKNIRLKNIRSYKETEIKFPDGAVLLAGDVGSGKTSVLLAIEYALFGLQPGQRGASLLAKGEEYGEVSLHLEIDGIKVVIDRGLKRSANSINQDFAAVTIKDVRFESSVTEVKLKILELLNYPLDFIRKNNLVYRYTVYTPQEEMKQIILEDIEVRLDILRHVFGIDKYKRIQDNSQRIIDWIRDESRTLQIESALLETKKNDLDSNLKFIKILESKITLKEEETKQSKAVKENYQKEVDSLAQLVAEKEVFKKEIEKSMIMHGNKQEQISRIIKDLKEIEEIIGDKKIQPEYAKLSAIIEQIARLKKTIELLDKEYIGLSSKNNSLDILRNQELSKKSRIFQMNFCPTCLQDVPEVHKHNIMNATEASIKDIEKNKLVLASEVKRIEEELKKQKENLKIIEHERITIEIQNVKQENIENYLKKKEELFRLKETLEKDAVLINEHIDSLKKHSLEYTKFENLLKVKKEELSKILEAEQKKEIELAEIRKEIELINREINKLDKEIYIGEQSRKKLINLLDVENWLSNNFSNLIKFTEKNILIALRKEFTKIFNKWFSMLTTDSFEVYLDENFSPVIVHNEFELDYQFLSGGERTAVALAYRLALNQLINSILSKIKTQDVIILDEPTEGFSEQQLDKMRDMLQEMHLKQLLIVSHETKMESFVDHVIRFRKINGISTVIQEDEKVS